MPYPEYPPAGRARAKLFAERIINRTKHFGWKEETKKPTMSSLKSSVPHLKEPRWDKNFQDKKPRYSTVVEPQTESHNRRVFRLAWPVIGENFLQTMLGIVDTFMVALIGAQALAGVGSAIQIMFFVIAALSATSVGSSVLVAQAVGAKDLARAGSLAKQSLVWSVIISIPLIVIGLSATEQIIGIFGMEPVVAQIGVDYLRVTMGTISVLTLLTLSGGVLRGAGDSRTPMLATAIANVVNVVLTYGFIFGELGLPELGVVGSAWGTFLSRIIGFGILFYFLWRGRNGVTVRGRTDWWPRLGTARQLLQIGIPAAIEQVLISVALLTLTIVVARLGTETLAAQRIVFNALSISFLPGIGFGLAATALVGQSVGAGHPEEGQILGRIATIWAVMWMSVLGLFFIIFRTNIIGWFTDDPTVVVIGTGGLFTLALTQPFWAISIVQSSALRGTGDTQYPLRVNTIGIWSAVLLGALFAIYLNGSLAMIWSAFLVTGPISSWLLWRRFHRTIAEPVV